MAHAYEGRPDGRQSNEAIEVSRFRPMYRALSDAEKGLHDLIKVRAGDLETLISQIAPCRETSLAMTKLEEAVMWAVKALTGPAGMRKD